MTLSARSLNHQSVVARLQLTPRQPALFTGLACPLIRCGSTRLYPPESTGTGQRCLRLIHHQESEPGDIRRARSCGSKRRKIPNAIRAPPQTKQSLGLLGGGGAEGVEVIQNSGGLGSVVAHTLEAIVRQGGLATMPVGGEPENSLSLRRPVTRRLSQNLQHKV